MAFDAFQIINKCLEPNVFSDEKWRDDDLTTAVNIYHLNNRTTTIQDGSFKLKNDECNILGVAESRDEGEWDVKGQNIVLLEYPDGFGIAVHSYHSDMTFSTNEYILSICPTTKFSEFDNLVLTNDLREQLKDTIADILLLQNTK